MEFECEKRVFAMQQEEYKKNAINIKTLRDGHAKEFILIVRITLK